MSNLLSAISGQFTKALIFGAFLPAVVFVVLNIILVLPLLPAELSPAERLKDFAVEWPVAIALFVAIVVSCILYSVNTPLIRLYEGYLFEDSWLGRRMKERQVRKLARMDEEINRLKAERKSMSHDKPNYGKVERQLTLLWFKRQVRFPPRKQFVTPTALGNVIAAFEHYPYQQYGIDSVTLWPRLVAKIDASYAGVIDDAKTSFDFFINNSFLLAVFALEYLCVGLYFRTHLSSASGIFALLGTIAVLGGLSWLSYRCSIDSAIGWGDHVKAAFDLYRRDLLDKLGYKTELTKRVDERHLWERISQGMVYGKPEWLPPYEQIAVPATRVYAEPSDMNWSVTKGVEEPKPLAETTTSTVIKYVLTVKNTSDEKATGATLVDAVPSGLDYIAGSAQLHKNEQSVKIEAAGTNPYRWDLGAVDAGQSVTITYLVLLRPAVGKASS